MNAPRHLATAAGCVVLLALPANVPLAGSAAIEHLDLAVRLLLAPDGTSGNPRAGFIGLLDALSATASDVSTAAPCRPALRHARDVSWRLSLLHPEAVASLQRCFRDTHGGAEFRVPQAVRSGGDAVSYCRAELQAARQALLAGRHAEAFERMIGVAVLVVTPVERDAGRVDAWMIRIGRQWWAALRTWVLEDFGWLSIARSSLRA